MTEKPIEDLVRELSVSSRVSLGLILTGVVVLAATVIYSATRLRPLEEEISAKAQEAVNLQHQIEAKQAELQRVSEAVSRVAQPLPNTAKNIEGWLYVGRIGSDGTWAPLSEGVQPAPSGQQTVFNALTVAKESPIVDSTDGDTPKTGGPTSSQSSAGPVQFVKSGTQLNVLKIWKEKSIGDGSLIWAKVNVAPQNVLDVGRKE